MLVWTAVATVHHTDFFSTTVMFCEGIITANLSTCDTGNVVMNSNTCIFVNIKSQIDFFSTNNVSF